MFPLLRGFPLGCMFLLNKRKLVLLKISVKTRFSASLTFAKPTTVLPSIKVIYLINLSEKFCHHLPIETDRCAGDHRRRKPKNWTKNDKCYFDSYIQSKNVTMAKFCRFFDELESGIFLLPFLKAQNLFKVICQDLFICYSNCCGGIDVLYCCYGASATLMMMTFSK